MRLRQPLTLALYALLVLCSCMASYAEDALRERTLLDDYVAKPDDTYSWKLVNTIPGKGFTTYIIDMKSQTWRSPEEVNRTVWQHWLVLIKPDKVAFDTGFLFISGGRNGGEPPKRIDDVPLKIALATKSVVAELKMIPNQPLTFHNDGEERVEDDLIGYAWDQAIKTGDMTWLPRLPMVKSAVRAMDTITAFMKSPEAGNATVDKFVVAGGSKRGWTTWLTGAADKRVVAIIPIVIDVVNVDVSMKHHFAAYGFWSAAVGDYVRHRIFEQMGNPRLAEIYKIVDPYSYRHRLTMPKLVLNAAGDQFFLPDSSQFYFDDLQGEKYLRYVPNADHGLKGSDAVETIAAFYSMILTNTPRPKVSWSLESDGSIRVQTNDKPVKVKLWQATNPEVRDFRLATLGPEYKSSDLKEVSKDVYIAKVDKPAIGWTAYFVELTYNSGTQVPLKLTTLVRVAPEVLPFAEKDPSQPGQLETGVEAKLKKRKRQKD